MFDFDLPVQSNPDRARPSAQPQDDDTTGCTAIWINPNIRLREIEVLDSLGFRGEDRRAFDSLNVALVDPYWAAEQFMAFGNKKAAQKHYIQAARSNPEFNISPIADGLARLQLEDNGLLP